MPVEPTVLPNGNYYLPETGEVIPADMATPSPDNRFHHCVYYPAPYGNGKANPRLDASLLQCTLRSARYRILADCAGGCVVFHRLIDDEVVGFMSWVIIAIGTVALILIGDIERWSKLIVVVLVFGALLCAPLICSWFGRSWNN
jgi:hypothetical protein